MSDQLEAPPSQIVNPESSSILFSKVPQTTAAAPSPSVSSTTHQHQLDNLMASRGTEHHHQHSKQQKKVTITTRSEIGESL